MLFLSSNIVNEIYLHFFLLSFSVIDEITIALLLFCILIDGSIPQIKLSTYRRRLNSDGKVSVSVVVLSLHKDRACSSSHHLCGCFYVCGLLFNLYTFFVKADFSR